jgi:hypothetical protein
MTICSESELVRRSVRGDLCVGNVLKTSEKKRTGNITRKLPTAAYSSEFVVAKIRRVNENGDGGAAVVCVSTDTVVDNRGSVRIFWDVLFTSCSHTKVEVV